MLTQNGLSQSIFWLIRLRWLAIITLVLTTMVVHWILRVDIPLVAILVVAFILIIINGISYYVVTRLPALIVSRERTVINVQISMDMALLTCILHFSGGVENPLIIIFIFHMIISSIILPVKDSYLQTSLALLLVATMSFSEYAGLLAHYDIDGFVAYNVYDNLTFLVVNGIIFIVVSYTVVYMSNTVTKQLKAQEETIRIANLKLKESDQVKNEFVLKLTHDIKGHLAAIQSCLNVVSSGIVGELEGKQKEFADRAYNRTILLGRFIKDMLNLTRLQLDKQFDKTKFPLSETIYHSLENFRPVMSTRNISTTVDIDVELPEFYGNQVSVEEMLSNLIANAVKYTRENGEVHVACQMINDKVILTVSDDGIGIPVKDQKFIFREFSRASNAKKAGIEGTGMGLAIVKQIVDKHNGAITVESVENKGTSFTVVLPMAK